MQCIGKIIGVDLDQFQDKALWFSSRDSIRKLLSNQLLTDTADNWIELLNNNGIWCGKVLNYQELDTIDFGMPMKQVIENSANKTITTTRSPIQLDGEILTSRKAAPKVGEHNVVIQKEFIC